MEYAKLSVRSLAFASAVLWGGSVAFVTLIHRFLPGRYGQAFLDIIDSLYPGYEAHRSLKMAAIGTGYAVVDGLIAGILFAWLYNFCAGRREKK